MATARSDCLSLPPRRSLLLAALLLGTGCASWKPQAGLPPDGSTPTGLIPNPLVVGPLDQDFLWNQLVDTIDDHFRIEREVRPRFDGGLVTDGYIDTFPLTGATALEPWRHDSVGSFEVWHATLQSIRRRARVRVAPAPAAGHAIEVTVYKELEDVSQPENATVGSSVLRHDGSLLRNRTGDRPGPMPLGWIPQGRDIALEQLLLAAIAGRLALPAGNAP